MAPPRHRTVTREHNTAGWDGWLFMAEMSRGIGNKIEAKFPEAVNTRMEPPKNANV